MTEYFIVSDFVLRISDFLTDGPPKFFGEPHQNYYINFGGPEGNRTTDLVLIRDAL